MIDLKAPINQAYVQMAKNMPIPSIGGGHIDRLYLHWAVSPYSATFTDYNYCIFIPEGSYRWSGLWTNSPAGNAAGNPATAHTWLRNSYAVGISVCSMLGASPSDFGAYPVTQTSVDYLCAVAARLAQAWGLDTHGVQEVPSPATDVQHSETLIATHAEVASWDDYDEERWDFAIVNPSSTFTLDPSDDHIRFETGNALRDRIREYKVLL